MNVLLVDDESIVLRGLQKMIDWDQLDLFVSNTAISGEQAIDIIKNEEVDIIVTDISMEGMSGLEMLRQLNQKRLLDDKIVIVLSGYKEFSYAQEAIKNNVFEYVTKPVARSDFARVLLLAKQHLLVSRKNRKEEIGKDLSFENVKKARKFINEKFFIENDFATVTEEDVEKNITKLIESINYSAENEIEALVNVVFDQLAVKSKLKEMVFKKSVFALYFEIYNLLNENHLMVQKIEKDSGESFLKFRDMRDWFLKQVNEVYNLISEKKNSKKDAVIQVKDYIDENINRDLSLSKMAAMAYMSPNYFCSVFKVRVGENLHDYILKKRMDEARKLLLTKQYRIYEVASMVGYTNARYFALAFKKYYKVSPTEMEIG